MAMMTRERALALLERTAEEHPTEACWPEAQHPVSTLHHVAYTEGANLWTVLEEAVELLIEDRRTDGEFRVRAERQLAVLRGLAGDDPRPSATDLEVVR